jgi:hypothetical protein
MRTRASVAPDPTACPQSPDFYVGADHLLVPPDGRNEVAHRREFVAKKIARLAFHILRNPNRAFRFRYPITSATENISAGSISAYASG